MTTGTLKRCLAVSLAAAGAMWIAVSQRSLSAEGPAAGQAASAPAARSVSFVLAADTHCGGKDVVVRNPAVVAELNALPTRRWPGGAKVLAPRGVIVCGDMTNHGTEEQWQRFISLYGRAGGEGKLAWPLYLASGNHDRNGGRRFVIGQIAKRHGALRYSWDWDDVHFISLDDRINGGALKFLRKDLAGVGPRRPVVIFMHWPFAYRNRLWSDAERQFVRILDGHNIIAVCHGHKHGYRIRRFMGLNILNVPSVRTRGSPAFYVMHINDKRMRLGVRTPAGRWKQVKDFPIGDRPWTMPRPATTRPTRRPATQPAR